MTAADIVDQLAAATTSARDAATDAAIAAGPAIATALLEGTQALAASDKARRLYTYAGVYLGACKTRVNEPHQPFDLRHEGPLGAALAQACEHARVPCAASGHDTAIDVDLCGVTFLQALDALCSAADVQWRQDRVGEISVSPGADPAYPAAYYGPCRVRVTEAQVERRTNYSTHRERAQLRFSVDWEWPYGPMAPAVLKLERPSASVSTTDAADAEQFVAELTELPPSGQPLANVTAALGCIVASEYEEERFDDPEVGMTVHTPGFSLSIREADSHRFLVSTKSDGMADGQLSPTMLESAMSSVVLGIDDAGEEAIAQVKRLRAVSGTVTANSPGEVIWSLTFTRDGFRPVRQLRLRLAKEALVRTYPLEFSSITLP